MGDVPSMARVPPVTQSAAAGPVVTGPVVSGPAGAPAGDAGQAAVAGGGRRLAWLDVLRGLAALSVVFNHFGFSFRRGLRVRSITGVIPVITACSCSS